MCVYASENDFSAAIVWLENWIVMDEVSIYCERELCIEMQCAEYKEVFATKSAKKSLVYRYKIHILSIEKPFAHSFSVQ